MQEEIRPNEVLNGRYQVQHKLGEGGMGSVYLAEDLRARRLVAVKVARLVTSEAREQFRREAAYLQKLHHHSLPRVWEIFSDTQRDFLVMEYISGDDLQTLVQQKGPQPEWLVLRWIDELLNGLKYLHSQNPPIIHRDIKPDNLKLRLDDTLVLVDFGIAKEYQPDVNTFAGASAFSPGFSPPEQYANASTDTRSDLYSVGAAMYFLLTGVIPPPAPTRASGDSKLLPPSHYVPSVSSGAELIIHKALNLSREQRWSSATEMAEMVDQAAQRLSAQPTTTKKTSSETSSSQEASRPSSKLSVSALGVAAGVFLTLAVIFILLSRPKGEGTQVTAGKITAADMTPTAIATPTFTVIPAEGKQDNGAGVTETIPAPVIVMPSHGITPTPVISTPIPTYTPVNSTATSTPIPTDTPVISTDTPTPKPTPKTVKTTPPAATSTAPVVISGSDIQVTLLEPNDDDTRNGEVTFRWNVITGVLPAGMGYEVFFYQPGQDPLRDGFGVAALTQNTSLRVNLDNLNADPASPLDPGLYLWSVRLIPLTGSGPWQVIAPARRLIYQPASGGGQTSPTNTPATATNTPVPATNTPAPVATNTPPAPPTATLVP